MKNNQYNKAIIITFITVLLCIIIIKLICIIIHRHFSTTTATTTTSPPPQIVQSQLPFHHHSFRFLFNNNQISPQPGTNLQSPHNQNNQSLINSLPTFKFESITGIHQSASSSVSSSSSKTATLDCAICITKFEKQDQLRLLPSCGHVFHSVCLDQWILISNHNCPICRSAVKLVENEDDDDELKMISSSRSFRVEIGSVSLSRRIDDGGGGEIDLQNRSYSLGSIEYWIQDFDAEVFVELERINGNRADDEISTAVGDGGGDEETEEIVVENRVDSDEVSSYARNFAYSLQFSERFYGGSGRRSGGVGAGMDEVGGDGGGGRVWDLEGNRFGEEISDYFGILSRV